MHCKPGITKWRSQSVISKLRNAADLDTSGGCFYDCFLFQDGVLYLLHCSDFEQGSWHHPGVQVLTTVWTVCFNIF